MNVNEVGYLFCLPAPKMPLEGNFKLGTLSIHSQSTQSTDPTKGQMTEL